MHILLASEACDTKYLTTLKIRAYCMNLEGFTIVTTRYSVSPKRKFSIYVISLGNDQVFDIAWLRPRAILANIVRDTA